MLITINTEFLVDQEMQTECEMKERKFFELSLLEQTMQKVCKEIGLKIVQNKCFSML